MVAPGNAPVNRERKCHEPRHYELKAEAREQVGKGSARAVRRNGKVPAVIYGDKQPPLAIALSYKDVYYKIHGGGFLTTIATIDVDGKKIQVLPKDFQLDPVRDFPMHVDFLRIGKDTEVNVEVPVHFINEEKSPGIKRGGVLNIVRHEIEFHCPANAIPEFITVDLTGTNIGNSIHISAVKLPAGVQPVISRSRLHDRHYRRLVSDEAGGRRRPKPTPEAEAAASRGISSDARRAVAMLLFAGLGNPGAKYAEQPAQCRLHGGGRDCPPPFLFALVEEIPGRGRRGPHWRRKDHPHQAADIHESVRPVGRRGDALLQARPADLTVFYDELDLAPGKVRVKTGGGAGGHNGIRSIDGHVGKDYRRVRIGIGHPGIKEMVTHHVLGDFAKADHEWLDPLLDAIADNAGSARQGRRKRLHEQTVHSQFARQATGDPDRPRRRRKAEPYPSGAAARAGGQASRDRADGGHAEEAAWQELKRVGQAGMADRALGICGSAAPSKALTIIGPFAHSPTNF